MDILALLKINDLKKSGGVGYSEKKTTTYTFAEPGTNLLGDIWLYNKVSDEPVDLTTISKVSLVSTKYSELNGEITKFTTESEGVLHVLGCRDGALAISVDETTEDFEKGFYVLSGQSTEDAFWLFDSISVEFTTIHTIDPKYFGKVINFDNYYFTTPMFPDAPMSLTMIVGFLMGNDAGDNSCLLTNEMAKQLAKELNEDDDIVAQFSTDNNMYTKVRNCKVTVIKDESGKTRRVHGFIFPMNMSDGANVNYTIIFMPLEDDTIHVEVVR